MTNAENLKEIMSKNLKYYSNREGITQTELANKLGIPEMTMSNWFNAKTYPRIDKIQMLADYFKIRRSDLTEDMHPDRYNDNIPQFKSNNYPYLPVSISAGLPIEVEAIEADQAAKISIPDSVMGKWAGSKDIFFMRVNGDSMNKVIPHHSLIAVKEVDLSNLNDGDIVVYSNRESYAVKHFYNDTLNKRLIFRPDSNDNRFTDNIVPYSEADNLKIHGKVVVYIVEVD